MRQREHGIIGAIRWGSCFSWSETYNMYIRNDYTIWNGGPTGTESLRWGCSVYWCPCFVYLFICLFIILSKAEGYMFCFFCFFFCFFVTLFLSHSLRKLPGRSTSYSLHVFTHVSLFTNKLLARICQPTPGVGAANRGWGALRLIEGKFSLNFL